jgi:hypothetical protein
MRVLVVSESTDVRQAARVCHGALAQEPPRMIRARQPGLNHAAPSVGVRVVMAV